MKVYVDQIEKRSWVEVNLSQLRDNLMIYEKNLKRRTTIMAVIKADAYGHGDVQVARLLSSFGIHHFAVSNIDEAVGLRESGIKGEILILGYTSPFYSKTIIDSDLTQSIVSEEYAEALSKKAKGMKCQFAIDTGMNRIGLNGDDVDSCEAIIRKYKTCFRVNGLFTHLCVADSSSYEDKEFTLGQISKFKRIANAVKDLNLPFIHCFNSAGGLSYLDDSYLFEGIREMVRLGIVLYGLKPSSSFSLPEGIKPALSWFSRVSMVKDVYPGETLGYGRSYIIESLSRIATVTTGYADGLNRSLSGRGYVLIRGKKAPIVGRICMDQTLVDVSEIPEVKMGDVVVIIGESGSLSYTADDMASDLGTIGYEIVCNISKRVQRFYTA